MVTILHLTPQIIRFLLGLVAKPPNSSCPQKKEVIQIGPSTFASPPQR